MHAMAWFRRKVNVDGAIEQLMAVMWEAVLAHGSQTLAEQCGIQGEWLTKEMLGLAHWGVTRALSGPAPKDWAANRTAILDALDAHLTAELVATLNEIEWQVRHWFEALRANYSNCTDASAIGQGFRHRVAYGATDPDIIAAVTAAGSGCYTTAFDGALRVLADFKLRVA